MGHGSYAIEREQEDLIAVLDRKGSMTVFGHSFGGLSPFGLPARTR